MNNVNDNQSIYILKHTFISATIGGTQAIQNASKVLLCTPNILQKCI